MPLARAHRSTALGASVLLAIAAGTAAAQRVEVAAIGVRAQSRATELSLPGEATTDTADGTVTAPSPRGAAAASPLRTRSADGNSSPATRARWAPAASALLPGSGQAMLDQNRFLPYLALEAFAWVKYLADSREGARQRDGYRRLARIVARSEFSSTAPTGNWEYYERMEHYIESGVYDAIPGGTIQPEPDTTTYNGSVWLLARETYWEDPNVSPDPASDAYAKAIRFYAQRAVTPDYRWSWRDAQLEQDLFRRTIARSNDYYRRAAQDLAVVIANHVLSTVDSYVTVRLRSRRGAAGRTAPGLDLGPPGDAGADGYDLTFRLPLPRR
jgi:hypothetical protein